MPRRKMIQSPLNEESVPGKAGFTKQSTLEKARRELMDAMANLEAICNNQEKENQRSVQHPNLDIQKIGETLTEIGNSIDEDEGIEEDINDLGQDLSDADKKQEDNDHKISMLENVLTTQSITNDLWRNELEKAQNENAQNKERLETSKREYEELSKKELEWQKQIEEVYKKHADELNKLNDAKKKQEDFFLKTINGILDSHRDELKKLNDAKKKQEDSFLKTLNGVLDRHQTELKEKNETILTLTAKLEEHVQKAKNDGDELREKLEKLEKICAEQGSNSAELVELKDAMKNRGDSFKKTLNEVLDRHETELKKKDGRIVTSSAQLEEQVQKAKNDNDQLKLEELDKKMGNLTWWMISAVLIALIAAIIGMTIAIYNPTISWNAILILIFGLIIIVIALRILFDKRMTKEDLFKLLGSFMAFLTALVSQKSPSGENAKK